MDPAWKKAQEDLKKELNKITRKDFMFKSFTDTYSAGGKVVQDQPSDFWALDAGKYYVIEVKSSHQDKFYFKDIRPSQMIAARRVPAAGGYSRFVFKHVPTNTWYVTDGLTIHAMKSAGENGVRWAQLTPINLTWAEIQ